MKWKSFAVISILCLILISCTSDYVARGIEHVEKVEYNKALDDFNKAIELNPQHVEAYINRGRLYGIMYYPELALPDLDKAIELDPKIALAYYYRSIAHGMSGNDGNTIEDLERALELGLPSNFKDIAEEMINKLKE